MSEVRGLTLGEINMLTPIFGDALDYSSVKVRSGVTADGTGYAPFQTINIGKDLYRDDFSLEPDLELRGFFVHENAHVMQSDLLPCESAFFS